MKIFFCIKSLSSAAAGGAERVFCSICSELVSRGDEVIVLTFDHATDVSFFEIDNRVKRINLGIGNSKLPATFLETIQRIRMLRKVVLSNQPNVVVGFMHSMFIPLAFSMIGSRVPVIGSEHITPDHYKSRPLQKLLFYISFLFLRKITVVSDNVMLTHSKYIRKKMAVVPNPIEFSTSNMPSNDHKSNTILAVGRLEYQKNHAVLIKAFSYLANDFPDWKLRIVGEGSLRQKLEKLITSLGLANRIEMPGLCFDIAIEYQKSKVFVIPSSYESFGLVIAEAMFFGLPVIGFADCPGINTLIDDGMTGVLVKSNGDKTKSLSIELKSFLLNSTLRADMGSCGQLKIKNYPNIKDICDIWLTTLYSVISKPL